MDAEKRTAISQDWIHAIKKVNILKHVRQDLLDNPGCSAARFYKRGEIVVPDSKESTEIFIVMSGSLTVMKKLKSVKGAQRLEIPKPVKRKHQLIQNLALNRQNTIYRNTYELEKRLEQRLPGYLNHSDRLGSLPYDAIIQQHRQRLRRRYFKSLDKTSRENTNALVLETPSQGNTPSPRFPLIRRDTKGASALATEERQHGASTKRLTVVEFYEDRKNTAEAKPVESLNYSDVKSDTADLTAHNKTPREDNPVFAAIQILERGQCFGLNDILFKDEPRLSVVSNGAECAVISKKFFLQHSTAEDLQELRMTEYPYPSTPVLQQKLVDQEAWKECRKKIYTRLVRSKKLNIQRRKQFNPQFLGEHCFRNGPA